MALLAAPNAAGYTPLHLAAASGDAALLEAVLGVLVHVRPTPFDLSDKSGLTALHWAVSRAHGTTIKRLVESGASVVATDSDGRTALHHAVLASASASKEQHSFFCDMVRYLLQSGVDVGAQENAGTTALHIAAENGDVEMMGVLVELGGAPVNAVDDDGETAIFGAIREGHVDAAKKLVDYGINLGVVSVNNETIVDYCHSLGDATAAAFLQLVVAPVEALAANSAAGKELENSANLFGSNSFRPVFSVSGNSAFVNR